MNRITRWIQERKEYSNPTFGALLILSAMTSPVFQASAAIEEPIQPMAQTAEQVVDALGAVEAGTTVDQAFGIQPVPYRELVKTWKSVYEDLFEVNYPVGGIAYLLDLEISSDLTDFTPFQGFTSDGHAFEIEFAQLVDVDLSGDEISDSDREFMASIEDNSLGVVASIRSGANEAYFIGTLFQWDFDSTRIHEVVILEIIDSSLYFKIMESRNENGIFHQDQPFLTEPEPSLSECERCQRSAQNQFDREVAQA